MRRKKDLEEKIEDCFLLIKRDEINLWKKVNGVASLTQEWGSRGCIKGDSKYLGRHFTCCAGDSYKVLRRLK